MSAQPNLITFIANALGHPGLYRSVEYPTELVFPMAGGGGGSPSPPEATGEERAFTQAQTEAMQWQTRIAQHQYDLAIGLQREQQGYLPFMYEDLGLTRTVDPGTGEVTFTREGEGWARRQEIQGLQEERSLLALKGELPVSPALEKDIARRGRTLHERLRRDLGSGYQSSTPGIQSLAEFGAYSDSLREGARTAELTTAEALSLNRQQANQGTTQNTIQTMAQPRQSTAALLGIAGGGYAGAGQTAAAGAFGLRQNRNMLFQGRLAGYEAQQGLMGGLIGGGAAIGVGALMAV